MSKSIAEINDLVRSRAGFGPVIPEMNEVKYLCVMTGGVATLPLKAQLGILAKVRSFSEFNDDNDPHKEHDFSSLWFNGYHVYFKFSYYAQNSDGTMDDEHGSEDPSNLSLTFRVLTVMLSEEY